MDGSTVLGMAVLDSSGVATLTLSSLSVGDHAITASYSGDADNLASDAALTQTVQKSHTATTLSSSTSSATYGQAITFTAMVSIADSGAGTMSGMVTFMDGSTVLGTAALDSNGVASFTVSNLAVGGHSITATYSGDANFTSSASNSVSETVNPIQTATTLVSSMPSSVYGQPVTFSATVIAASGAVPAGSVLFMDGANVLGTATLDAAGMATLTVSSLAVGSHTITATYGGSATDAPSSDSLTQTVGKISTSTALASSADPSVYGQAVTLTATVSGGGGGNVMFMEGATLLGTAAVDSNGVASITLSSLSVGGHDITASYGGDDTHSASSASLTQSVNRDRTVTHLELSAVVIDFGQSVLLTATVEIADLGSGTPTGTVTFMDGDVAIGTATLGANGVATFTCSAQVVGDHAITAVYSGDGNFAGSISNSVSETVNMLGTSTSLLSSIDPSSYGQSVLFTATVSGGLNATGTVTFRDGSTVLGTVAIDAGGVAHLGVSSLSVGDHAITASYSGDADNAASSASLMQVVNANSTATALTSSAASVTYGHSVTFTATVSLTGAGSGTPTGNVIFKDGSTVIGTVAIDAGGVATLTTSSLSVGGHTITAAYSGDANDLGSSASMVQNVTQRATATALSSSLNPSVFGQAVTFTATVTNDAAAALSGSVVFKDGSTILGTVSLSGGAASLTLSTLAAGGHTITATYSGDANDAASSASLIQSVTAAVTSAISGHVYNDVTGNGLSANDTALGGVTVKLFLDRNNNGVLDSGDGAAVASAVSSSSTGAYSFANLAAGRYFTQEVTPTGYVRTAPTNLSYYTAAIADCGSSVSGLDFDNFHSCPCSGDLTNVTYIINDSHTYGDLRNHVHEGDVVTVRFTVLPGHTDTLTLVSYTAPGDSFDPNTAGQQKVYDYQTQTFGAGVHTLTVVIPPCDFQVDFVCGYAIDHFGPADSNIFYTPQSRLISADNGGTHLYDPSILPLHSLPPTYGS
jgi:hypothetical protein